MVIDIYKMPELYDAIYSHKKDDIPFYMNWSEKTGGPILELASGTGRLAAPFIKKGIDYTGLDMSREYVEYCHKKFGTKENFIQGDMQKYSLGKTFDLIFIGFNSFLHLYSDGEAISFLECVKKHLSKRGKFLIDIFIPDPDFLYRDESQFYDVVSFIHPKGGKCMVQENSRYDELLGINSIHWVINRGNEHESDEYHFDMRMYYPDTMDRLLTEAGFCIDEKWGDYNGELFNETSLLQLYICSVNK